jgi:hypothetical protein
VIGRLLLVNQSDGIWLRDLFVSVAGVGWVQNLVALSFTLGLEVDLGQLDLGQLELGFAWSVGRFGCLGQLG